MDQELAPTTPDPAAALAALKKAGKITDADILEALGPTEEVKRLTDVLHFLFAAEDQAMVYHRESNTAEAWDQPAHRYWLRLTYVVITKFGGVEKAIQSVERVTSTHKRLSKDERTMLAILDHRVSLADWTGIAA